MRLACGCEYKSFIAMPSKSPEESMVKKMLPYAVGKPASLSKDHKKLSGSEPNKIFCLEMKHSQKATSQKLSLKSNSGQSYEYRKHRQKY